ncbi:unnamed protein product [Miscanthus lutarioriparius]|uniref:Uncharacterized protein n=1 Tax=Miscanthus lutarioriparius TaxID=422564 RepID=A0A811SGG3_9POAL|nr:unnamed protein product [Miscanthus lutarioriparius]
MRALARFARLNLKDRRVIQQMLCSSSSWESAAKELAKSPQVHRCFSTGREPPAPDFLCSKRAKNFISSLEVKTQDFADGYGSSQQLQSEIKASLKVTNQRYSKDVLEPMYHRLAHSKKKPRFISSYDLMVHLVGLLEAHWVFFLNYLVDERIAVVEEWISICTVQHLMYDHGLKDFGSDIHFYKGECDAAYFHADGAADTSTKILNNGQVKSECEGKADLATIIWDNDQVISSLTYRGVGKPVPGKPAHGEIRAQKYYVEVAPDKKNQRPPEFKQSLEC